MACGVRSAIFTGGRETDYSKPFSMYVMSSGKHQLAGDSQHSLSLMLFSHRPDPYPPVGSTVG